eukprot:3999851-Lingulodinium_polyedra.AAC.1
MQVAFYAIWHGRYPSTVVVARWQLRQCFGLNCRYHSSTRAGNRNTESSNAIVSRFRVAAWSGALLEASVD